MPYIEIMTKEDFMSTLYKNRWNLTFEVLDDKIHGLMSMYCLLYMRIVEF